MGQEHRLNKITRELNISLEKAKDFLKEKNIENINPNSKISDDLYKLFKKEFQNDVVSPVKKETPVEKEVIKPQEIKSEPVVEKTVPKQDPSKPTATPKPESENNAPSDKIQTNFQKLSGIKKTGETIDIAKFTPKEKEKKSENNNNNKKQRKRIYRPQSGTNDNSKREGFAAKKKREHIKRESTDNEIKKQVSETLEKLKKTAYKSKGAKYRKDKREIHKQQKEDELEQKEKANKIIKVTEFITVGEIASLMEVNTNNVISVCMSLGIMVTLNQRLDAETLEVVADEFGYKIEFIKTEIEEDTFEEEEEEDSNARPPVITIMGHVDHGKTSLLDYIRKTNVIAGEYGGITQHIGAYSVTVNDKQKITFLDTPGHEAFTAMRARGAQITDIVIIIVAADDGIMPQTEESINHAKAANIPIIIAINKIDKPDANVDKVKEKLAALDLSVEDWGGKIQSQNISAKNGTGIKELLEKVLLEAELLELKCNPNKKAKGTVIEALLDKGRGYISTVLVQNGTLKVGDYILAGKKSGKVRAIFNERGNRLEEAPPSTPVSIIGLDGAPQAGDAFHVIKDEREAKKIAAKRTQLIREQNIRTQKHLTLDEIGRRIAIGNFKEFNVLIKGDVDGSVEALTDALQKISTKEIQLNIIHKAVGAVTESDILLAATSNAFVIGFNVQVIGNAKKTADKENVNIKTYSIIYDAIDDIKKTMEGMLAHETKEETIGEVEIREVYKISKIGNIAGCMVTSGRITRNSKIRVFRDGKIILNNAELESLKRFKDDIKEVKKGYDCGLQIKNYNNIQVGDTLEAYEEVKIKKKL